MEWCSGCFIFIKKREIEGSLNAIEITTNDEFCKKFANQNVPDEIVLSRLPALDFDNPFETINKISSWVFNVSSGDEGYLKKNFFDYSLRFNISNHEFERVKKIYLQNVHHHLGHIARKRSSKELRTCVCRLILASK